MIYIDEMENRTSQKGYGSLAPHSLYSADAGLPEALFGSRAAAREFAARFEEVSRGES